MEFGLDRGGLLSAIRFRLITDLFEYLKVQIFTHLPSHDNDTSDENIVCANKTI